jgi:hypothetical protein
MVARVHLPHLRSLFWILWLLNMIFIFRVFLKPLALADALS